MEGNVLGIMEEPHVEDSHEGGVLPPNLYLVVFYKVSLVNETRITYSNFIRPLEVLLKSSCCTISDVHTPWENYNKCYSMIVSVKDSVS